MEPEYICSVCGHISLDKIDFWSSILDGLDSEDCKCEDCYISEDQV